MKKYRVIVSLFVAAAVFVLAGCQTAAVDRTSAKAQAGAPESAEVEILEIEHDASFPTYVMYVEPLTYGASGVTSGGGHQSGPGRQVGPGMAAQLGTALSYSGNIELIEKEAVKKSADGTYTCKLQKGEVGPFIIRGSVTEFNETADLSESGKGASFGFIGVIAALVGAFTDNDICVWGGAGIAAADPTYKKQDMKRKGMVAMDLRIVKGWDLRSVRSFRSAGTFVSVSSTSGLSIFGMSKSGKEFAASALGQATRAAMNDAVQKITDGLKKKLPKGR